MSNQDNANAIISAASRYGIPAWIPLDIARRESGLNAASVGDNGTSFGLFQLHRGGLAPSNRSNSELLDPKLNADIAVRAMQQAYTKGVQAGYAGESLLDYVANSSGWPGHLGVSWTDRNRPDYNSVLNRIYQDNATEAYIANYYEQGGAAVVQEVNDINSASDPNTFYADGAADSGAASAFRMMAEHETVQSYKNWKAGKSWQDKINPFAYVGDQGAAFGIRTIVTVIGLVCVILALWSVVKVQAAEFNGSPAEGRGPVEGLGMGNAGAASA